MKKLFLFTLSLVVFFSSCDKEEKMDPIVEETSVKFTFSQNFNGETVTASTFNQFNYVNANGDTLSLTKLRYLLSDFVLTRSDGSEIEVDGYQLVDVTNGTGLSFSLTDKIPTGNYSNLSFTYGFDSLDNTGNYTDLNAASWNWPAMLGGGYHFMQMEGLYKVNGNDSIYAYHNGTARKNMNEFEQNFVDVTLPGFTLTKENTDIEIKMNIDEWYENPNTWDFSIYNKALMPNYAAQKLMQENAATVFTLGDVIQTN